jgi:hypothetical protein
MKMDYIKKFLALVNGVKLITILILVIVDFVLGVVVAIKEGTFKLSKLADFLNTTVLYLLGGYFLIGIVGVAEPAIGEPLVISTWILLDATMVGSILAKAKKLGVPVPERIT